MNRCYLVSIDGTSYFSSNKIHCDSCCTKTNSRTGEITYQHHVLGAAIVHPDIKEVIPLAPEPIIKQDEESKNDSERNASKRFFKEIKENASAFAPYYNRGRIKLKCPIFFEIYAIWKM